MSPEFIVIDTNIFISAALSPNGTAYQAFARAVQRFTIAQSNETYQEIAVRAAFRRKSDLQNQI